VIKSDRTGIKGRSKPGGGVLSYICSRKRKEKMERERGREHENIKPTNDVYTSLWKTQKESYDITSSDDNVDVS